MGASFRSDYLLGVALLHALSFRSDQREEVGGNDLFFRLVETEGGQHPDHVAEILGGPHILNDVAGLAEGEQVQRLLEGEVQLFLFDDHVVAVLEGLYFNAVLFPLSP